MNARHIMMERLTREGWRYEDATPFCDEVLSAAAAKIRAEVKAEERRTDLARDVLLALLSNPNSAMTDIEKGCASAVRIADALLVALDKKKEGDDGAYTRGPGDYRATEDK